MTIKATYIKKEEVIFEAENIYDAGNIAEKMCPEGCEIEWEVVNTDMITDYENPYL